MNCSEATKQFSDIYDNQPSEAFSEHLLSCKSCAQAYEDYAILIKSLRDLPEPDMPADFHESLMTYVRENTKKQAKVIPFKLKEEHINENKQAAVKTKNKQSWYIKYGTLAAASLLLVTLWFSGVFSPQTNQASRFMYEQPAAVTMQVELAVDEHETDDIEFRGTERIERHSFDFGAPAVGTAPSAGIGGTPEASPPGIFARAAADDDSTWSAADSFERPESEDITADSVDEFTVFTEDVYFLQQNIDSFDFLFFDYYNVQMIPIASGQNAWIIAAVAGIIPLSMGLFAVIYAIIKNKKL